MSNRIKVLQGITVQYFHVLPSELNRVTVSPERDAIFQFLAHIGSDQFVEFVTDILVHAEGHQLVDTTDGPGDEKQDILTIDRAGLRHLTQCKHTADFRSHARGDELDVLLGACLRKNCRSALYVTNGDLTAQGKRYINDGEYARGWDGPGNPLPVIDYWNGARIWERISRNGAILNKWFSGMAQVHGLRNFSLDLIFGTMPSGRNGTPNAEYFLPTFRNRFGAKVSQGETSFNVEVDDDLSLTISDSIRVTKDLELPYVVSAGNGYLNVPLAAVRVDMSLSPGVTVYDPAFYRDRVAYLFAEVLPDLPNDSWWHVVVTPAQALCFLHDAARPVWITVSQPEAYVRVRAHAIMHERRWAVDPGEAFERVVNPEDRGDRSWKHRGAGFTLRVFTEHLVDPEAALMFHFRQKQIAGELATHSFRVIENADPSIVDTVRRLCDPRWFVLRASSGDLFWAYPPGTNQEDVGRIESALTRRGIEVLYVEDRDREQIISHIDTTPPVGMTTLSGSDDVVSTPVDLRSRMFWFSREVALTRVFTSDNLRALLAFKCEYEARYGYDLLDGRDSMTIASGELRRFLFDVLTVRGRRMVDVGFTNKTLSIHLRVREADIESASQLALRYVEECVDLEREILGRLDDGT